jgi:hypothetical protein
VIPALNAERFIGQAIESVHAQTLKNFLTVERALHKNREMGLPVK